MWKKATIGGLVAVAVVGGGAGVAIAHAGGTSAPAAASASPTATATTGASATKTKGATKAKQGDGAIAKEILGKLKDFQHAEWVTKGDANAYVTHDAILGTVQAVSASAITVASADGTSMTFAVNDQTTVRQPQAKAGKATKATTPSASATPSATKPTIADVKTGQTVLVGGTKSPDLTATNVLVRAG